MNTKIFLSTVVFLLCFSCKPETKAEVNANATQDVNIITKSNPDDFAQNDDLAELVKVLPSLIDRSIRYDPSYAVIGYPNGDVPANRGVCTDVVIRAYRKIGIDLQKEVHEDMKANFDKYPKKWGLNAPDTNIDHRRVPNLMTFFSRHGKVLKITNNPKDYQPGEIVCWDLGGGILHIGIVANTDTKIIHNIGYGQVLEDCLFNWKVIGHYSYSKKTIP